MSSRNKRTRRCESEIRTMSRLEPTSTAFIFIFFCVGFRCFADAWNYEKFMARFFCSANRALSQWFSCIVEFEILTVVCVCERLRHRKPNVNLERIWQKQQQQRKWLKSRHSNEKKMGENASDKKISLCSRVFLMFVGVHSNPSPAQNHTSHTASEKELKHLFRRANEKSPRLTPYQSPAKDDCVLV